MHPEWIWHHCCHLGSGFLASGTHSNLFMSEHLPHSHLGPVSLETLQPPVPGGLCHQGHLLPAGKQECAPWLWPTCIVVMGTDPPGPPGGKVKGSLASAWSSASMWVGRSSGRRRVEGSVSLDEPSLLPVGLSSSSVKWRHDPEMSSQQGGSPRRRMVSLRAENSHHFIDEVRRQRGMPGGVCLSWQRPSIRL